MNKSFIFILISLLLTSYVYCTKETPSHNYGLHDFKNLAHIKPAFEKSYFNSNWKINPLSEEQWYYRMTVVDVPSNTQALTTGEGHWLELDIVKWEITQNYLLARRAHESVPGAEDKKDNTFDEHYRGGIVAAFAITDHFDIKKDYDPLTLEETKRYVEDKSSKPWFQRQFFRVDWSVNQAKDLARSDAYAGVYTPSNIETSTAHVIDNSDPSETKRYKFEKDYFDVTTSQAITVDLLSYLGYVNPSYAYDASAPIVSIRSSFKKVDKNNDYVPLHYPDSVVLTDAKGKIRFDDNHNALRQPIWEKFGFYRTGFSGRQTWVDKRGSVESGKIYNITRFNIWQKSRDESGEIAVKDRTPKSIVYYTNIFHPKDLLPVSQKAISKWNEAFKEVVFYAQPGVYDDVKSVPDMVVLRENNCNLDNVAAYVKDLPETTVKSVERNSEYTLQEIQHKFDVLESFKQNYIKYYNGEMKAKSLLQKYCSALEFYTAHWHKPFSYQREGDIRYNLINVLAKSLPTKWSGLGPMFADPLTGEIISATSNINLSYLDNKAHRANQYIETILGKLSKEKLVYGYDVASYILSKEAENNKELKEEISEQAIKSMDKHFTALQQSGSLTKELPIGAKKTLISKSLYNHDRIQSAMSLDDDKASNILFGEYFSRENNHHDDKINLFGGNEPINLFWQWEKEFNDNAATVKDSSSFIDNLIMGVALQYKDLDSHSRFMKIRESTFYAVVLHELGHNFGLTHNMAGSSDALNYGEKFWQLQNMPKNLSMALEGSKDDEVKKKLKACINAAKEIQKKIKSDSDDDIITTQDCLRQQENMYSSVMDYHASWNSDINGLGLYDKAAIKFGYAQLLEVFDRKDIKINTAKNKLSQWLFLHDWKKIPQELFSSAKKINKRKHIVYSWNKNQTSKQPSKYEVPYRFCLDASGYMGPHCKAFDFGPDMKSQAKWLKTKYWQHYHFTHFAGDKIWSYNQDFQKIIFNDLKIFADFTNIMNWYYYYKAKHQEFSGSDAEKDFLSATVVGLNHFSHVLGHPKSGLHITATKERYSAGLTALTREDRLKASNYMLPQDDIDGCEYDNSVETLPFGMRSPIGNHKIIKIGLGDGRPFFMGLTDDYEDAYLNYIGSFYSKIYVPYFLGFPGTRFPKVDSIGNPQLLSISWYKLFPDKVGKLMYDIITNNKSFMGPLVDENGTLQNRNIIDPVSLNIPDYSSMTSVEPSISSRLSYRSILYANAFMSNHVDGIYDLNKSMKVMLKGASDYVEPAADAVVAEFIHPISGHIYQAIKVGEHPIAYDLVNQLNALNEKYLRLKECINNQNTAVNDKFCHCFSYHMILPNGDKICCSPANKICSDPQLVSLNETSHGRCSMRDLQNRKSAVLEKLNDKVGFLDDMRWFVKKFSNKL